MPRSRAERGKTPRAEGGARKRSSRGSFGQTWWATEWEQALSAFLDPARLQRGRNYVQRGEVLDMEIQPGQVLARVQGTPPTPYRLRITVQPFSDGEWGLAIDSLARQASYSAMLLNGQMPRDITLLFDELGFSLFPTSEAELGLACSCPDYEAPCKHLAAVLLRIGEELDRDPFLLFVLRGRTREQVVQALRERRADRLQGPGEVLWTPDPVSEDVGLTVGAGIDLSRFWRPGPELATLQIRVERPEVEHELLQVLGAPDFVDDESLQQRLPRVYDSVTRKALEVAFDETHRTPDADNGGAHPG